MTVVRGTCQPMFNVENLDVRPYGNCGCRENDVKPNRKRWMTICWFMNY